MRAGLFRLHFCLALLCAMPLTMAGAQKSVAHHKRRHHFISLQWHRPVHSPVPVVSYNVYRSEDGGATFHKVNSFRVRRTTYIDFKVNSGTTYFYEVKSVSAKGVESAASNRITLKVP